MKKIKLLSPILGLTTLTSCLVPLTSCGGDNQKKEENYGNVSEAEWKAAFDEIWDVSNANRNFTAQIRFDLSGDFIEDEDLEYEYVTIDNKTSGLDDDIALTLVGKPKEQEEKKYTEQYYFINNDGLNWNVHDEDGTYSIEPMSQTVFDSPFNWKTIYEFIGLPYGWYNAGEFINDEEGYKFTLINSDPIKLWISFAFDSTTKKLIKMNGNLEIAMDNITAGLKTTATVKDYGTTTITSFDKDKFNTVVETRKCSATLDKEEVTVNHEWSNSTWYAYYFNPSESTTDVYEYDTIHFNKESYGSQSVSIIVNGTQLLRNIDYSCTVTASYTEITFNFDKIKSTDKVILLIKSNGESTGVTECTVSNEE